MSTYLSSPEFAKTLEGIPCTINPSDAGCKDPEPEPNPDPDPENTRTGDDKDPSTDETTTTTTSGGDGSGDGNSKSRNVTTDVMPNGTPLILANAQSSSFWSHLPSLNNGVIDSFAGFGDTLSFGVTDKIRGWFGWNGSVDQTSIAYTAGQVAGAGYGLAAGGAGMARAGLRWDFTNWKSAGKWVAPKGRGKWHFHFGTTNGELLSNLVYAHQAAFLTD